MSKRFLCLLLALAAVFSLCVPSFADESGTKEPAETGGSAATENAPEPGDTPEPTASPEPSDTPTPSEAPEPSETPNPSGSPEPSASPEAVVPEKLPAPKLTRAENTDGGIAVAWEGVPGAAWYRVYYKTAGGGWTKAGDTTGTS